MHCAPFSSPAELFPSSRFPAGWEVATAQHRSGLRTRCRHSSDMPRPSSARSACGIPQKVHRRQRPRAEPSHSCGLPADQVGSNDGRIGGRLVHVPGESGQDRRHPVRPRCAGFRSPNGRASRVATSGSSRVVLADAVFVGKCDGISAHRLARGTRHHGHDAGGIQPCAQKGADRNVADHLALPQSGGSARESLRPDRLPIEYKTASADGKRQVPILREFQLPISQNIA